ncbi:MAG TPA: molecular chaperone [Novosphingobium sp.]|nr:molecular chaperone [Novosphingobium sp.]
MTSTWAKRRRRIMASLVSAALAAGLAAPAHAVGDLLIAPTRVILNGSQGTEVVLNNIGDQPATYRITLELRRMNSEGELDDVSEAEASALEKAALEMIRYAPRRITLPPDQPQAIRITARPGANLPDGEYRVHMSFRAIPEANPVSAPVEVPENGFVVQLTPIYGITIPIIVRKGRLEASAALSNPRLVSTGEGEFLQLDVARSGNRSLYGAIEVFAPGAKDPVYAARGVAVYPELSGRKVMLPVGAEQAAKLHGPLHIEYREAPEAGGKLIAAVDAKLP